MSHMKSKALLSVMAAISAMTFYASSASAEDMKFSASAIGRPPIFSNTFVDVGQAKGYWKKAGLDMNFRWFQRGTDTAKAVVTGDVQVGYTATPPAVNLIASGAPIVAIAGMPNQDWVIASNEAKDCKDLKGKTVAADGINIQLISTSEIAIRDDPRFAEDAETKAVGNVYTVPSDTSSIRL